MTDWLLVLMVLSVAAVLACLRFVGCALIYDYSGYTEKKTGYDATIKDETSLLAYWRLGEPVDTVAGDYPTAGDAAKDEIGSTAANPTGDHPGTYEKILLAADAQALSPATNDPPIFTPGQQGLIPSASSQTSVQVDGGFVSVPFSSTFNPSDKPFSVEAWVNAEWEMTDVDVFRCVVTSRQDTGVGLPKFGYILYAGPLSLDPAQRDGKMHWQAWVGDGTANWVMLVMDQPVDVGPTYLLLTWDGAKTMTLDVFPLSATMSTRKSMQAAYKPVTDTTVPLFIGMGTPEFATLHYPFLGRLQEIAFYNEALTPAQVDAHVKAAKGEEP